MLRPNLSCLSRVGHGTCHPSLVKRGFQSDARRTGARAGGAAPPKAKGTTIAPPNLTSLPPSKYRFRFRQLPFSLDAPALYGISLPLNKSKSKSKTGEPDLDRPARRLPGLNSDSPPAVAWSCEYFAIKAVPPTQHGKRSLRFPDSYFPKPTIPEVTNKDLPTPPPALDRYVLESQGKHLSREERQVIARRLHHKTYTMDLTVVTGKKNIHKLASVRNRIRSKIRHSIRLLVQYGISYDPESGEMLHLTPGPREWLLPGHIYLIVPSLEVYLLPWAMLSSRLATALQAVRTAGRQDIIERRTEEELARVEEAMLGEEGGSKGVKEAGSEVKR